MKMRYMRPEAVIQRYYREAEKCELNARRALKPVDREAWLQLAEDWRKLARAVEVNPIFDPANP